MLPTLSAISGDAVVLFSGGIDSTVLASALASTSTRRRVALISFDDGSPDHEDRARGLAANAIQGRFSNVVTKVLRFPHLGDLVCHTPHAIAEGEEAVRGHSVGQAFWVGYKPLMWMLAASWAMANGYSEVVSGHTSWNTHFTDELSGVGSLVANALNGAYPGLPGIKCSDPLRGVPQEDIILIGVAVGAPLESTYSCMGGGDGVGHCGVCLGCVARRARFSDAKVQDPTRYLRSP